VVGAHLILNLLFYYLKISARKVNENFADFSRVPYEQVADNINSKVLRMSSAFSKTNIRSSDNCVISSILCSTSIMHILSL